MTKQEYTLASLLKMLIIAQNNMLGNKGQDVALITSSSAGKFNKNKGNKKKKPQVPGPSKKIAKQKGKTKADGGKGKCFHWQKDGIGKETAQSIASNSSLQ